ncbi:hypothetical protein PC128_g9047 [Phytophthora cactorum]|nr:hypothetical protein PC128_g9047 [Phytophthora cactorum]
MRREHQRFVEQLESRSSAERARLMKEYAAYLTSKTETDADFGVPPVPTPLPASEPTRATFYLPLRPPIRKDAAYLMSQRTLVSQHQRALAAKTLARSGKKRLAATEESDVVDEHDGNIAAPSSKRKAKPTSKARRPKKPTQTKKTRKLSAAKVAKKRAKGKRRAAAELACGVSADAEERGAVALEDARKKREAIAATKARKWQKTTVTKATKVSPTRYIHHITPSIHRVLYSMMSCQHVEPTKPAATLASSAPNSTIATDFPSSPDTPTVECDANPNEFEMLNSDCGETETEICFYDDDDEWIRAICEDEETGGSTADEGSGDEHIRGEVSGITPIAREECDDGQPLARGAVSYNIF